MPVVAPVIAAPAVLVMLIAPLPTALTPIPPVVVTVSATLTVTEDEPDGAAEMPPVVPLIVPPETSMVMLREVLVATISSGSAGRARFSRARSASNRACAQGTR